MHAGARRCETDVRRWVIVLIKRSGNRQKSARPAHILLPAANFLAGRIKRLHDDGLVLASSLPGSAAPFSDFHQLEPRFRRILHGRPGKQVWQRGLFGCATQDNSRGHHPPCLCGFFNCVSQKSADVGARFWLPANCGWCVFRFSTAEISRLFTPLYLDDFLGFDGHPPA